MNNKELMKEVIKWTLEIHEKLYGSMGCDSKILELRASVIFSIVGGKRDKELLKEAEAKKW